MPAIFPTSPIAVLRPLVSELRSLYLTLPPELRNHARARRRETGAEWLASTGNDRQQALLSGVQAPVLPPAKQTQVEKQARLGATARAARRVETSQELAAVARIADAVRVAGAKRLNWSNSDVRDAAAALARRAEGFVGYTDEQVIRQAKTWLGVPFDVPGQTPRAQRARLENPRTWRRVIRRVVWQAVEMSHLTAGMVSKQGMQQVSNYSVKIKAEMLEAQEMWLEATTAESFIDGKDVKLSLATLRTAEVAARLAEFWCWCEALQTLAANAGLEVAMLTLTLEPEYHPAPAQGRNSWNGISPAAANREITDRWAQLRAALAQQGITLSGFRAAEAHADGCPHWHLLICYQPSLRHRVLAEVVKLFRGKIALRTRNAQGADSKVFFDEAPKALAGAGRSAAYKNEGAQAELAVINTAVSSVVTYVTKYVLKQGRDNRAEAWRSCHGIRGLQWFGIRNALTSWRELRRLKECNDAGVARALWNRARGGDAAGFLELLGGLGAAPVAAKARVRALNASRVNAYGEAVARRIGVDVEDIQTGDQGPVVTRLHEWTLRTEQTNPVLLAPPNSCKTSVVTVIARYPSNSATPQTPAKNTPAWADFLQKRDKTAREQRWKVEKAVKRTLLWQAVEQIRVQKPPHGFTQEQIMAFSALFLPEHNALIFNSAHDVLAPSPSR